MLVPATRLLIWCAALALPLGLLAAAWPAGGLWCAGAFLIFALVALVDAARGFQRLEGLGVEVPAVTRLSKDRAGALEVRVKNDSPAVRELRLGLPLPRAITTPTPELRVTLPPGGGWSRLRWPCTAAARGSFPLRRVHFEAASPLALWAVRGTAAVRGELRVYPNLFAERKNVAALFLNRGAFGIHARRQVGQGRDFEKLRDYIPGDGYEEIHWKATAKRGRPVTKVFQIERTQEVYVVVDASRLSARPADGAAGTEPALERFLTAALVLGLAAQRQGDLFGLVTFSDRVERFLRAKSGPAHYAACRDALHTLTPRLVTPDFAELAACLRLRLRRRALLVVLTALDDPVLAENFTRGVELLSGQHLVLVNMLQPPAAVPLFSRAAPSVDDIHQHLGGHLQWHKLRELEKVLRRRGVKFSLLPHARLSAQLITQYLEVKQRQML